MVDRLKVAEHGVLGGRLVKVPQLQKKKGRDTVRQNKISTVDYLSIVCVWFVYSYNKIRNNTTKQQQALAHLHIHELVVGAGGQQEASRCVGKLTVVDLLFMLLLKHPQQHGSLHVPHLRETQVHLMTN